MRQHRDTYPAATVAGLRCGINVVGVASKGRLGGDRGHEQQGADVKGPDSIGVRMRGVLSAENVCVTVCKYIINSQFSMYAFSRDVPCASGRRLHLTTIYWAHSRFATLYVCLLCQSTGAPI